MTHELSFDTSGKAEMAYANNTAKPWHGLGQTVDPNASVADWQRAAGLEWEAKRAVVKFEDETVDELHDFTDKHVLYRSDNGKPLSVVSSEYKTVQPSAVLGFFGELAEAGDFQIETVGALKEGRRIWAMARIGENARIMDDEVAPFLFLATSYDGTMATIAKFSTVRVVCNNTLQAALRNDAGKKQVTINHNAIFNPKTVRADLGIALNSWEEFQLKAGLMAQRKISDPEMDAYLQELLADFIPYGQVYSADKVKASKGYQRIVNLFKGGQIGAGQDAINGTMWGLLNATTQYIDHEKGRINDNRLDAAWFGTGAKIKDAAYTLALNVVA